ncbi:hypothetical protein CMI37_22240 [Candidatus Pacearchaeota archaeon]|nr:hypothetical protein [Candidatus Pacearchaeota archaeon]|tara:strand:- start:22908 stop:23519 length:612 start_codon:yes stop_codon:yes gene_type:complete
MKAVFIHVAKCAGTSINYELRNEQSIFYYAANCARPKKTSAQKNKKPKKRRRPEKKLSGKRRISDFDESYYSFGFVRNPFERMVSAWKCPWVGKPWCQSFLDFLYYIDKTDNEFAKSHVWSYLDPRQSLFNPDGTQRASFIGRYERLQEDFDSVCSNISIKQRKLPHLNKREHKPYQEYYNEESTSIVSERYKEDLKYFDYEF